MSTWHLLIPLGNYVTEREAAELLTEDEATYAILAKKQAEEENSVDENGQLIGKDKSEETRQASVPTMDLSMERLNIENLKSIIEAKDDAKAQEVLHELYPADIAELYQELNLQEPFISIY